MIVTLEYFLHGKQTAKEGKSCQLGDHGTSQTRRVGLIPDSSDVGVRWASEWVLKIEGGA